jgi:hypothetical protein
MKKFVVGFFLVISLLFIGFISGGTIAKFFFIKAGDGLAGAATAAMLGLLGAAIGLVLSIILLRKLDAKLKGLLAITLTLVSIILFAVFHYQFKQRQKEKEQETVGLFGENRTTKSPTALAMKLELSTTNSLQLKDGTEMGIGIVSIPLENGKVLRFYGKPKHFELPEHLSAVDSLTFKNAQHYVDIATAPPWFVPEYMKLDYGILQLVAVTVQQNWIEVIVNRTNGQTSWVYKEDIGFSYWPEFLLNVHSVELLNPTDFPPRIKPMDHASPDESVDATGLFFPVSVKDDWLQVHSDKEVSHDIWVRWKRDGILLLRYSLLS